MSEKAESKEQDEEKEDTEPGDEPSG